VGDLAIVALERIRRGCQTATQQLRCNTMRRRVHGASALERHPGRRTQDELKVRCERLVRRQRFAALEHRTNNAHAERPLGEQPIQHRILRCEVDVRVNDATRLLLCFVGDDERIDEALPADAGHLEEEAIERSPVVIEEAGRLSERLCDRSCREIVADLTAESACALLGLGGFLLQKVADEGGSCFS